MRAVLFLAAAGCATVAPVVDADTERAFYQRTVEGLEGRGQPVEPATVDWGRFRQAAHLSLDQVARDDRASALQVLAEVRHRSDGHALPRVIDQLLRIDFADAQVHLEKARALHFDDKRGAAFHEAVALGLLRSILASGDGQARPWRVFDAREEEAVVSFLDLTCPARSSNTEGGRRIDVLGCNHNVRRPGSWHHLHIPRMRLRFDVTPPEVKRPS
jgi:hypothetical protein